MDKTAPTALARATPAAKTALSTHLAAVLEAYDGDVDRAAAALADLQQGQQHQSPPRKYGPVIVQLDHVERRYKRGHERIGAVNDVTLEIRQGEFLAVTGPSGSGKSTLLNLIGGLDKPTAGTVTVDGHNLAKLSDPRLSQFRNRTVGFVFQFFYLQPFLNVRTNLAVPGMFSRLRHTERDQRISELATAVGISDRLEHLPKELSGGQMQRAAIARALLNRPKLILADEPTGNVDRANAHAIMQLFAQVRDAYDTTIIIVTHDAEAARLTDRIITIRDGRIA
jgi:ABC-type lipoprotein export system ATPase subunit